MAEPEAKVEITASELAAALKQWITDSAANSWDARTDEARHLDQAEYLIHTVRIARGEGAQAPKEA